ncbi:glycerophosphoryl diester phosphodiesterase membrane domain-containing protein [Streptomyces apocyni]|uniref:glycerophosphoryl diester phosphodiesterase membrane domain-containing protein n=1 Tax=Streptomyces apocyni TaxID=2654677 RepID=UPI0012E9D423|nr:glycerophosphoryl diester phosphodiesterase membrane domain-containing protein [Streptomyces apocyni]
MNDSPGWASPGSAPSDGPEDAPPTGPADQRDDPPSKWSKDQPPAASWTAPGAPGADAPPPQGPGQGGPGNWGGPGTPPGQPYGSWGGRPAAAKPGVIPLRPLGVGEILDGAVSTMRTYWRTVLGISLGVAATTQILIILLQGLVLSKSGSTAALNDPDATIDELTSAFITTMLESTTVLLVSLLGSFVVTALLTMVMSRAVLGKSVTTAEAWRDARPQLPRLLGLTFLLPLLATAAVAVGALPGVLLGIMGSAEGGAFLAVFGGLAGIVVAVWLLVRFSLSPPALMLEKQNVRKSLSRSAKLVRGSWWRVFGIQLLALIIVNVVVGIILIPFSALAVVLSGDSVSGFLTSDLSNVGWAFLIITGIGSVIGSTLTFPITAGVTVLLYIDQRIRREALDLELARAAGAESHGTESGTTTGG